MHSSITLVSTLNLECVLATSQVTCPDWDKTMPWLPMNSYYKFCISVRD